MHVDLIINEKSTIIKRRFQIQKHIADELDLYVQAAQKSLAEERKVDDSMVLEAILEHHFRRDRKFKNWKKMRQTVEADDKQPAKNEPQEKPKPSVKATAEPRPRPEQKTEKGETILPPQQSKHLTDRFKAVAEARPRSTAVATASPVNGQTVT